MNTKGTHSCTKLDTSTPPPIMMKLCQRANACPLLAVDDAVLESPPRSRQDSSGVLQSSRAGDDVYRSIDGVVYTTLYKQYYYKSAAVALIYYNRVPVCMCGSDSCN